MPPLIFKPPHTPPPFFLLSPLPSTLPQPPNKKALNAIPNNPTKAPDLPKRTQQPPTKKKKPPFSTPAKKKRTTTKKISSLEQSNEEQPFDDDIDFPYESPPLICCFGAAQREFVPTVRVSERQMHPDQYSSWKALQWNPPEFVRAPGGPPSNVAVSHARLGGRAAFMGKVGDDDFGNDLVYKMNMERVQTRAVKIDGGVRTGVSYMRLGFWDDGERRRMGAEMVKDCAEDCFLSSEIDVAVLKEVLR